MFSYRHAFHAANHADVLKHMTLVAILRYMAQKDTGLTLIDTHAGAGVYKLDGDAAHTSGEAQAGLQRLVAALGNTPKADLPVLIADYLDVVAQFNPGKRDRSDWRTYPGSPWIAHQHLRPQDKLKLFEVHPTDARHLRREVNLLARAAQIEVIQKDSFTAMPLLLPTPTRRGLVLIDPSYELKSDYGQLVKTMEMAMTRFPTATYAIWYPVIARTEAHAMAKKLKAMAQKHQRAWVQAELNVGSTPTAGTSTKVAQGRAGTKMRASGMFVINPPFTLAEQLKAALPVVTQAIKEPVGSGWTVEQGGQ